jgi:outer membrane protein, heavy metal efflux system
MQAMQQDSAPLTVTRRQAIAQALANNPQLEASREQIAQARARRVEATALPDPGLSGSLEDQTGALQLGSAGSSTIGVGFTVPFPYRQHLRGKLATSDVRVAEFSYTQLQQLIGSQTAQSYDALLVALRHARDLTQAHELALDFVKKTQARFNAGTAAKLDVIKAQVDASQVQNDIISAERDVANAGADLNRLLGRSIGARIQPADSLAIPASLPAIEVLRRQAAGLRPELASLQALREGARAAATLARTFWLPDLSLGLSRSGGDQPLYSTQVGFGFPVFFWQHRRGEVAEANHHEMELAATARDLSAQVEQEVHAAYADASTALRQVTFLHDQLIPEAQEAYRIASVSYGLGGISALEVLDARRALIDAQLQYADALGAANDAVARLELAVGGTLSPQGSGGNR